MDECGAFFGMSADSHNFEHSCAPEARDRADRHSRGDDSIWSYECLMFNMAVDGEKN